MSAENNDIYAWPSDWFGAHRAYRVDRALKTVRRQLSGLVATVCSDEVAPFPKLNAV